MTGSGELSAMLDKAARYINSAQTLRQGQDFDSAISRLYYSMFYCAEAILTAYGYSFSSHKAVISSIAQYFVKPGLLPKHMHAWLREGFEKRQISDYDFTAQTSDADVDTLYKMAEQYLRDSREFLVSSGHLPDNPA